MLKDTHNVCHIEIRFRNKISGLEISYAATDENTFSIEVSKQLLDISFRKNIGVKVRNSVESSPWYKVLTNITKDFDPDLVLTSANLSYMINSEQNEKEFDSSLFQSVQALSAAKDCPLQYIFDGQCRTATERSTIIGIMKKIMFSSTEEC